MANKTKQILKKIKRQKKKYDKLIKEEQARCPHIKKSGEPLLKPIANYQDDDTKRSKCERCGAVVVTDPELLHPDAVASAVEVVQAVLSTIKGQVHVGNIKLDDKVIDIINKVEIDVFPDLQGFVEDMSKPAGNDEESYDYKKKKNKHNGGKKKKNKHKKKNKRERFF